MQTAGTFLQHQYTHIVAISNTWRKISGKNFWRPPQSHFSNLHVTFMISPAPTTGIETDPRAPIETDPRAPIETDQGAATFHFGRTRLIQALLCDQTDTHAELVQAREWLLHRSESIQLRGNAFALEDILDGSGTVFIKLAPLSDSRTKPSEWDLRTHSGGKLELNHDDGYEWLQSTYAGGLWGRIAAFHRLQRLIRPYNPAQDGLLLTNTWGDRNRDAHLSTAFLSAEIEAAARLGAEVVQLDDGWQKGMSANSHRAAGRGAWDGFWAADPNFWDVNPQRFPNGLDHLIELAANRGLKTGLWFAPDSSNEASNWRRDADALLRLHRLGIEFFKIDALKITTAASEANFRQLFETVHRESRGLISFDFDITAERRFGYFDLMESGRLFVENRYTDWGNYWPHHTLRTAWQLSHWIDPVRLRLEWLNHGRNADKYKGDPLAPSRYRPDALFATTMIGSPLGWFENQNLPPGYFDEAAPLIATWKRHRQALQRGTVLPVGQAPDGLVWTGFISIRADKTGGYALLFRELNPDPKFQQVVPLVEARNAKTEILGGGGEATLEKGVLTVTVPEKLRFIWLKFEMEV
jgi:alpha-galactosidase